MKSELTASNAEEWRRWLKRNHARAEEIWLVYLKKGTGKPSVSYIESVEEAICFGWIDGIKKRRDDERYTHRFTPRKPGSKWSPRNIELAKKMIAEGKMARAGLLAFRNRKTYDHEFIQTKGARAIAVPPDIEKALKANKLAWKNFNALAPGYRKQYIGWLSSAKKQETLEKRLSEAKKLLSRNQKLGMK